MPKPERLNFYIDPNRCIGCQACVQACTECDTHRGDSMIHLEFINRSESVQTVPVVCMHCEQPTCAEVCPADAIKRTGDGVVQSALKPRCIACGNCVLACPFGVPEVYDDRQIMMKCDMCYDRTSTGRKPMCATVCPSQALFFGTKEEIEQLRPMSAPINRFQFGNQTISTRVYVMAPAQIASARPLMDVTSAMSETPAPRAISLKVVAAAADDVSPVAQGFRPADDVSPVAQGFSPAGDVSPVAQGFSPADDVSPVAQGFPGPPKRDQREGGSPADDPFAEVEI